MFPGCANGRGIGNYSTTGKWPAVEQDQPANAEVPRGAPVAPPAADGRTLTDVVLTENDYWYENLVQRFTGLQAAAVRIM